MDERAKDWVRLTELLTMAIFVNSSITDKHETYKEITDLIKKLIDTNY